MRRGLRLRDLPRLCRRGLARDRRGTVADAAARLEAAIARGFDASTALAELGEAVAEARAAIEAVLRRS